MGFRSRSEPEPIKENDNTSKQKFKVEIVERNHTRYREPYKWTLFAFETITGDISDWRRVDYGTATTAETAAQAAKQAAKEHKTQTEILRTTSYEFEV